MYYQVYPNMTNEADYVVLASGLGGHASFWQPQIQALQAYFHVVVYDQEGCHADSAALPKDYSFFNLAEQVEQLLCHLQIKRFHLLVMPWVVLLGWNGHIDLRRPAPRCSV